MAPEAILAILNRTLNAERRQQYSENHELPSNSIIFFLTCVISLQ